MNHVELFWLIGLLVILVGSILWNYIQQKKLKAEWEKFQENRKELYARLADPKRIEEDFEKGARLREMYDAKRTTLPREDAGPPAVVYRPLLRGQKPGSWRPRNPGSPSKE